MFNWKFLKKVKIKGVSMVEYAVLLAFVAIVAGVFMDDGGLEKGIKGNVDKILTFLDGKETGKNTLSSISFTSGKGWRVEENSDGTIALKYKDTDSIYGASSFVDLDGPGHYTIQFDYDKFVDALYATGDYASKEDALKKADEYMTDKNKYGVGFFLVNGVGHSNTSSNLSLVNNDDFNGFYRMSTNSDLYEVKQAKATSTKLDSNADSAIVTLKSLKSNNTSWYNGIEFTSNGNNSLCLNMENGSDIATMQTAIRNALIITKK